MKTAVRFVLLACAAMMATVSAAAERVIVRSGEHDGFSRLVLHLPARTAWTLSGEKTSRQLVLDSDEIEWDLSEVFKRISSGRISSITPLDTAPGLSVAMTCMCDVNVFWDGGAMLVVDVRDPGFKNGNVAFPQEQTENSVAAIQAAASNGFGSQEFAKAMASGGPDDTQTTALVLTSKGLMSGMRASADRETLSKGAADEARQTIARQVARATALGLVDANTGVSEQKQGGAQESGLPNARSGRAASLDVARTYSNLSAHTSADRDPGYAPQNGFYTSAGVACIPDDLVDVAHWGTADSFARQIGTARRNLLDAREQQQEGAFLALARLYLYFGFGAEAEQVIESAELNGDAAIVAVAMAQLLDRNATESRVFDGQTDCAGAVALWSNLAALADTPSLVTDADAVLRALAGLPAHLKTLIGPRLAEKLLENGKPDASGRVLRFVGRSLEEGQPDLVLARAESMLAKSGSKNADADLLSVVRRNTDLSPVALVRLIDRRLERYGAVPPDWAELAGSFAQEQRETELGQGLIHSYLGALAAGGRFDTAFGELGRLMPRLAGEASVKTADIVASYTVRNADDVAFLKHLGLADPSDQMPLSPATENEIARRLLDMGFPVEAFDFLSGNASGQDQRQRRLLRAEAALARSAPAEASASLMGLEGGDVDVLRARANALLGRHAAAWPLYLASGNGGDALQQALLAGDWQEAAEIADPDLASIIDISEPEPAEDIDRGPLAHSEALLEESEAAKSSIARILAAQDVLPPGGN